jgi:hypothetical protein
MLNDDSPTDNGLHLFGPSISSLEKEMFPMWFPKVVRSNRAYAQASRIALVFGLLLVANIACGTSRISGTYIAHGPTFVNMLQLAQTGVGQITGVFNSIELSSDGTLNSENASITGGALDGEQLTLTFHPGPFGTNLAGTMRGNTIRLQTVGSNGNVLSWQFERSSSAQFKIFADQLKSKGEGIILSAKLLSSAQELRQAVQSAEQWISNAELHAQRIPAVKDYYRKIENEMRSLVTRERGTPNSVARSQISVMVNQGDVAGTQADVQVDQMWDLSIGDSGQNLSRIFANSPSNCDTPGELQKRGATPQSAETWQAACQQALTERLKFEPVYKRVMEQRADLKSFQAKAQSNRQALVDEASRIQ